MRDIDRALRVALVVVAAGVVGAGCGDDDSSPGTDAGMDSGGVPATDAGMDSGDVPATDASSDAGSGPGDAGSDAAITCAWSMSAAGTCDDAIQVSAGEFHACARRASGAVVCWGMNEYGRLGDGSMSHSMCPTGGDCSFTPVTVTGIADAVGVSAGSAHSCAVRGPGAVATVLCWGANHYGQLGDGSMTSHAAPVAVSGLTDGVEVAAGGLHTCARRSSGAVVCWGEGSLGTLGDGTTSHSTLCSSPGYFYDCSLTPVSVLGLTDAVEISAGASHTCARRASGAVVCWGANDYGQLGDGTVTNRSAPVAVSGLTDASKISAGSFHTCAVRTSGAVVCWGNNSAGQIGDGSMTRHAAPVAVSGLADAIEISAADSYTCAVRASGAAVCWGANYFGALGDGTTTWHLTPVSVSGLTDAVQVAGAASTCAVRASGAVVCWGTNLVGQLGDGTTTDSSTPVMVLPPSL